MSFSKRLRKATPIPKALLLLFPIPGTVVLELDKTINDDAGIVEASIIMMQPPFSQSTDPIKADEIKDIPVNLTV